MKKIFLIIAPHQDDEISIGGAIIPLLQEQGFVPHVLFSTNGDYRVPVEIRMREASHALSVLGVKKRNIHILGYGDTVNSSDHHHIFYSEETPVTSPAGHGETYGSEEYVDYAYLRYRVHSPYIKRFYHRDLAEFLLELRPDIIFCVDFDIHADHRMLSLSFDHIMGLLLRRENNDYFPQVFKSLSYALSFYSYLDFWQDNIFSTQRPVAGMLETYDEELMDCSLYTWADRVRFPVPRMCISNTLSQNLIYHALKKHRSQWAELQAPRVINGDCVYWERRTDSLTYCADIRVSSGNAEYLRDFKLYDVTDIDCTEFLPKNYLWQTDVNDSIRTVRFSWKSPQRIELIRLWGNIYGGRIEEIAISSSSGETILYGPLKNNGQKNDIFLERICDVQWVEITIIRTVGDEVGLAEVEFFSHIQPPSYMQPFIKCMIDGHFVYDYCIEEHIRQLTFSVYQYGIQEAVFFSVEKGKSHFEGNILWVHPEDKDILVKAYTNSLVCDIIKIRRLSKVALMILWLERFVDRLWWKLRCSQRYISCTYTRVKRLGIKVFAKKVIRRLCRYPS